MEKPLFESLKAVYAELREQMWIQNQRHVSLGDLFTNRWETASFYGFGEGSSCYDNVLVIGDVKVGKDTWIGPNCILDGSGGLEIGDNCSIAAGVQIYSHHTVMWANSMGKVAPERGVVKIGSGVYIGPQSVIQMNVSVGDRAVIGACSFVNRDIPSESKAWGCPATIQNKGTAIP